MRLTARPVVQTRFWLLALGLQACVVRTPKAPVDPVESTVTADPASMPPAVEEPPIVDWPVTFDGERARLMSAYLGFHRAAHAPSADAWADVTMVPRMIVLHHTAGPTATSAWNTFAPVKDRRKGLQEHQKVNLSTHFVIDRDGTIFRLFDESLVGRHTIGLNHLSIGVENVGGLQSHPLTDAQVEANAALIRWLRTRFPTITHVIGHHEYRSMEGHPYFDEVVASFRTVKIDPGPVFMAKVRARIRDLDLSGPPDPALVEAVASAERAP